MSRKVDTTRCIMILLLFGLFGAPVACGNSTTADEELGPTPIQLSVDGLSLFNTSTVLWLLPDANDGVPELSVQMEAYGEAPQFGRINFTLGAFHRVLQGEVVESGADTRSDVHGDTFLRRGVSIEGVLRSVAFDTTSQTMTLKFENSDTGHETVLKLSGAWPRPLCYPDRTRYQNDDPDLQFETQECQDWLATSGAGQLM